MKGIAIAALATCLGAALGASAQQSDSVGQAVFDRHCVHCHGPGGEAVGTVHLARTRGEPFALLTQRNDLSAVYIEAVVRNGLKAMPAFVPSDLTEADLDALADFLTREASPGQSD